MKILQIHNHYTVKTGGEFMVAEMDRQLLESHGHRVIRYIRDSDEISAYPAWKRIALFCTNIWSARAFKEITQVISQERPDLVHAHNLRPLISPSVIYAANRFRVPFVWTLHNYPLVCLQGSFLRNNRPCTLCLKYRSQVAGLIHGCYSRPATTATYFHNKFHRLVGTWKQKNLFFVVLARYMKDLIARAGVPSDRIFIKGNTIFPDPGAHTVTEGYAVFVGRPVEHKGIYLLLEAMRGVDFKLKIIGASPLTGELAARAQADNLNVEFAGALDHDETIRQLQRARFLVLPSLHTEGFPLVIVEAYACGVPVITHKLGPLSDLVEHHKTGIFVDTGNVEDLRKAILFAASHPDAMRALGETARQRYLDNYHHEKNYKELISIYETAISTTGDT